MSLFRKRNKLPPGTIERDDQFLVPEDDAPPELVEGADSFRMLDEWDGEPGPFVGLNAIAVRKAVEARMKSDPEADMRAVALEEMNNPRYWRGDDDPDEGKIMVCRVDPQTGKLDVGPALVEMLMGRESFGIFNIDDQGPSICLCRETVMEEVYERIAAMGHEISEDEHRALTYEVMDDPVHWTGNEVDDPNDSEGELTYSFYPFDPRTGRIRRD